MSKAGQEVHVAYEEAHECKEGCACEGDYVDQVQQALVDLGSDDPAGDVARHAKYVRGAKRAGLEPNSAAAMILAMSSKDPTVYTPRFQLEESGASEYVAVDNRGKKVFGPTGDYQEAVLHAKRARGWVEFEMRAKESAAADYDRKEDVIASLREQHFTHIIGTVSNGYVFRQDPDGQWAQALVFAKAGKFHIGKPERFVQVGIGRDPVTLPPHATLLTDAGAQYAKDAEPPPPVALEPYTKKVRFHRGAREGTYEADLGHLGKARCTQRSPDRRNGKLPWVAVVRKQEICQADTKALLYAAVEEWAKRPQPAAAAEDCARIVHKGDVDVVERDPKCTPSGVKIDTPKRLHAAMRDLVSKQGTEVMWAVGMSKQGEMVGQPVVVNVGQVDRVSVDVADFIGTAATLRKTGAVSVYAVHPHPSNKADTPSSADRDLTKRLREGMRAIGMPFEGHYVMSRDSYSRA